MKSYPRRKAIFTVMVLTLTSWLLAIAALLAILRFLPVTPGYLPDHVE
jgi:uncharacterized membrane protein YbhN (UPF0104 family)